MWLRRRTSKSPASRRWARLAGAWCRDGRRAAIRTVGLCKGVEAPPGEAAPCPREQWQQVDWALASAMSIVITLGHRLLEHLLDLLDLLAALRGAGALRRPRSEHRHDAWALTLERRGDCASHLRRVHLPTCVEGHAAGAALQRPTVLRLLLGNCNRGGLMRPRQLHVGPQHRGNRGDHPPCRRPAGVLGGACNGHPLRGRRLAHGEHATHRRRADGEHADMWAAIVLQHGIAGRCLRWLHLLEDVARPRDRCEHHRRWLIVQRCWRVHAGGGRPSALHLGDGAAGRDANVLALLRLLPWLGCLLAALLLARLSGRRLRRAAGHLRAADGPLHLQLLLVCEFDEARVAVAHQAVHNTLLLEDHESEASMIVRRVGASQGTWQIRAELLQPSLLHGRVLAKDSG
mmetsp:Transcript_107103/g.299828  ORF Transcript_107103/g.299828 Transcript_107103/m.299828 type:complete len:403 (-) Transcript_107103:815-2023(-)